jgi:hypothetical protein
MLCHLNVGEIYVVAKISFIVSRSINEHSKAEKYIKI